MKPRKPGEPRRPGRPRKPRKPRKPGKPNKNKEVREAKDALDHSPPPQNQYHFNVFGSMLVLYGVSSNDFGSSLDNYKGRIKDEHKSNDPSIMDRWVAGAMWGPTQLIRGHMGTL